VKGWGFVYLLSLNLKHNIMVIAEAWSDNGLDDIKVLGVKNGHGINKSDFDLIDEAIRDKCDDRREFNIFTGK